MILRYTFAVGTSYRGSGRSGGRVGGPKDLERLLEEAVGGSPDAPWVAGEASGSGQLGRFAGRVTRGLGIRFGILWTSTPLSIF